MLDFPSPFTWFSLMLDSRSQCLRQMVPILGCATMVVVRIACYANVSSREGGLVVSTNRHDYDVRVTTLE